MKNIHETEKDEKILGILEPKAVKPYNDRKNIYNKSIKGTKKKAPLSDVVSTNNALSEFQTQRRFMNERSEASTPANMKSLSKDDLAVLKSNKDLKMKLRENLQKHSKDGSKCSIGIFKREAASLGINLSESEYQVMLNAFGDKK